MAINMKHKWFNQAKTIALVLNGKRDSEKLKELIATIFDGLKEETGRNPSFEDIESELRAFLPRNVLYKEYGKGLMRLYYSLIRNERDDKPKEFVIPLFVRQWREEMKKTESSE